MIQEDFSQIFELMDDRTKSEMVMKEWVSIKIKFSEKTYNLFFISLIRLQQEVNYVFKTQSYYFEPNLIMVPEVTEESIKRVLEQIWHTKLFHSMISED